MDLTGDLLGSSTPNLSRFVLHWGEMGTRWGINRTVAQVHALLYISPRPLNAVNNSAIAMAMRSAAMSGLPNAA